MFQKINDAIILHIAANTALAANKIFLNYVPNNTAYPNARISFAASGDDVQHDNSDVHNATMTIAVFGEEQSKAEIEQLGSQVRILLNRYHGEITDDVHIVSILPAATNFITDDKTKIISFVTDFSIRYYLTS